LRDDVLASIDKPEADAVLESMARVADRSTWLQIRRLKAWPLSSLRVTVLRLLAGRRKRSGESYVAGGVAHNYALQAPRISRDEGIATQ
jgi:hypothetical protein